jgi:hypothetical protein
MTYQEFVGVVSVVLWPLCVSAGIIGGVAYAAVLVGRRRREQAYSGAGAFIAAFTALGLVVGFATAHSRDAALGAVLPALLSVISAVLTYALTKEGLAPLRPILPHCITLLCVSSIIGLSIGGTVRKRFVEYDRVVAERQGRLEKVTWECEKARYITDLEIYKAQKLAEVTAHAGATSPHQ